MNNNNVSQENNNNVICEAVECNAQATSKLAIRVGTKGVIFLFLCDNCRPKFLSSTYEDSKKEGAS
jgi:hypothetical protein